MTTTTRNDSLAEVLQKRLSFDSTDRPGADDRNAFGTTYKRPKHNLAGGIVCWTLVGVAIILACIGCIFQIQVHLEDGQQLDSDTSRAVREQGFDLFCLALSLIGLRLLISIWLQTRVRSWYSRIRRKLVNHPPAPSQSNGFARAVAAIRDYEDHYSYTEIANAHVSLASPAQVNPRIVHNLTLSGQTYRHVVNRKAYPGPEMRRQKRSFAVVHRAKKGIVLDNFSLRIDGADASTLSLRESRILTAAVLTQECSRLLGPEANEILSDYLWLGILTGVLSEYPTTSVSPGFIVNGESNLGSQVAPHWAGDRSLLLGDYIAEFARRLSSQATDPDQHSENRAFVSLLVELAENQVIWAKLPVSEGQSTGHIRVTTEYSTRYLPEWGALSEFVRMKGGLIPKKIGMSVPLALEAMSYHLEIDGPAGMYFYDLQTYLAEDSAKVSNWTVFQVPGRSWIDNFPHIQQIRLRSGKKRKLLSRRVKYYAAALASVLVNRTSGNVREGVATARSSTVRHRFKWIVEGRLEDIPSFRTNDRGIDSAHVYARSVSSIRTKSIDTGVESHVVPQLRWELRERPPGILLPGLLLGVYVTTLVWTVALVQDGIFGQCGTKVTQGSAILFGVPAILSAWVLSKFNGEHVERASGVSLFVVAWCVANAMLTTLAGLALIVKCEAWKYTFPPDSPWPFTSLSGHTIDRITWNVLMLATAANLLLTVVMIVARMGRYGVRRDGTVDKLETMSLHSKGK